MGYLLKTKLAKQLGIPYLSKATESDAQKVVRFAEAYIRGVASRTINSSLCC